MLFLFCVWLIVICVLIVVVVMIVFSGVNIYIVCSDMLEGILSQICQLIESYVVNIIEWVCSKCIIIGVMKQVLKQSDVLFIVVVVQEVGFFDDVYIGYFDKCMLVLYLMLVGYDLIVWFWYKQVVDVGKLVFIVFYVDVIIGKLVVIFVELVSDKGILQVVLGLDV